MFKWRRVPYWRSARRYGDTLLVTGYVKHLCQFQSLWSRTTTAYPELKHGDFHVGDEVFIGEPKTLRFEVKTKDSGTVLCTHIGCGYGYITKIARVEGDTIFGAFAHGPDEKYYREVRSSVHPLKVVFH